jgi:glucuronate isomerase
VRLATPVFTTQGLLKEVKVKVVCATDDPVDNLEFYRALADPGTPKNAARV